jgi:hypothetical protein
MNTTSPKTSVLTRYTAHLNMFLGALCTGDAHWLNQTVVIVDSIGNMQIHSQPYTSKRVSSSPIKRSKLRDSIVYGIQCEYELSSILVGSAMNVHRSVIVGRSTNVMTIELAIQNLFDPSIIGYQLIQMSRQRMWEIDRMSDLIFARK